MFKLPVRTWVRNAAAVFSGPHGAVTHQADQAGCSRETVYQHARKVEQRLAAAPADPRLWPNSAPRISGSARRSPTCSATAEGRSGSTRPSSGGSPRPPSPWA